MRSIGEVLALGSNFNQAFLKALRSLELGLEIPSLSQLKHMPIELKGQEIREYLKQPNQLSLLAALEALRLGLTIQEIFKLSKITPWYLEQMEILCQAERSLSQNNKIIEDTQTFIQYKQLGMSDKYLALLSNQSRKDILAFRFKHNIFPSFNAVDTCSGEFFATTPYFYSTFDSKNETDEFYGQKKIAILGSGPNRIGQGIEFDYSCVKSCQHLRKKNYKTIMINSNPETVSTDYDSSDRLYISPLYSEDIFDILYIENPDGVIASFSGQTGIKIQNYLEKDFYKEFKTFPFLGASHQTLDLTEDRNLFSDLTKNSPLAHTKKLMVSGYKKFVDALLK